jgi:hypothetical protein
MLDLQLFRLKVVQPIQRTVWSREGWDRPRLIEDALQKTPERKSRGGSVWHVGNLEKLDDFGWYFRFGRTSRATLPFFDSATRSFVEQDYDSAPYTHAVVDSRLGLCALARKTQLAHSTGQIANQLEKLLNDTSIAYTTGVRFSLEAIKDPQEFIDQLKGALAILSFGITFGRPNPFDANELFQKPMEQLLDEAHGAEGQTTIEGEALDPDVLTELTRSAAATGNDAEAVIVTPDTQRRSKRRLRETNAFISLSDIRDARDRLDMLRIVRAAYSRIRQRSNE